MQRKEIRGAGEEGKKKKKRWEEGGEASAATSEACLFHVYIKQLPNEEKKNKKPEVAC